MRKKQEQMDLLFLPEAEASAAVAVAASQSARLSNGSHWNRQRARKLVETNRKGLTSENLGRKKKILKFK